MHPNHNPQFREAQPPISLERFDGNATDAITRQQDRLEEQIDNVNTARMPHETGERLYGYNFTLSNGNQVDLGIDVNAAGEPIGADREFVDTRNRLAVLRSRERSRGSRRFNFAFMRHRGAGPGGHGYQRNTPEGEVATGDSVQEQYDTELSSFIARKVDSLGLGTEPLVTEAVSRSIIQEQKQMGALEGMAAEQKSGARFLNFFRNHKKSRLALSLALTGVQAFSLATGQLELLIPATILKETIAGTGSYVLGRTLWDAGQGRRARRLPHDDIRMAGSRNGDFSGQLSPEAAFERFVKLHGAEARAGSHDSRRQALIRRLGAGLVHEYYTGELDFSAGHDAAAIETQVNTLHQNTINPLQEERLKSDQTQSRRRHVAGMAGALIVGAIPGAKLLGFTDFISIGPGGHGGNIPTAKPHVLSSSHITGAGNTSGGSVPPTVAAPSSTGSSIAQPNPNVTLPSGTQTGTPFNSDSHFEKIRGGEVTKLIGDPTDPNRYQLVHGPMGPGNSNGYITLQTAKGQVIVDKLALGPRGLTTDSLNRLNGAGITTTFDKGHLDIITSQTTASTTTPNVPSNLPSAATAPTPAPAPASSNLGGPAAATATPNASTTIDNVFYETQDGNIHRVVLPDPNSATGQALQALTGGSYVPETGLPGFTPDQAAQAQAYISEFANSSNSRFAGLTAAARASMEQYIQASIDHPGPSSTAQQAAARISDIWMAIGHNIANATADQAENLEDNLAVVNVGKVYA